MEHGGRANSQSNASPGGVGITAEDAGHRRFGHKPQEESGQGDPELRAGEVAGQRLLKATYPASRSLTGLGSGIDTGPVHSNQTELGRHEESVGDEEDPDGDQARPDGHALLSLPTGSPGLGPGRWVGSS